MIASMKFILYCVAVAVVYGILHDQITARVCVEYFTIGHPIIIETESPTILGLLWGVVATWWGGLIIGLLLLASAGVGRWGRYPLERLYRPVALIMAVAAPIALAAGFAGYRIAEAGATAIPAHYAALVPPEHHSRFVADLWAHNASYDVAFLGGIGLAIWVMVRRTMRAQ